MEISML